jgi:hypothetical protein
MKMQNINVSNVPENLKAEAERIAKEQGKPLAQVMKDLLREWVAEQTQKLPQQAK